jgi:hypothetical protein
MDLWVKVDPCQKLCPVLRAHLMPNIPTVNFPASAFDTIATPPMAPILNP